MSTIKEFDFDVLDSIDVTTNDSFAEELEIDKYNLDEEWKRQPYLCYKWTSLVAEAEKRLDDVKSRRDLCKANLDAAVRRNPQEYGLLKEKPTEAAILGVIVANDTYRELEEKYIEAKRKFGIAQAASRAVDHKKQALENMVKLFLNNYYAEPFVPKDAQDKFHDQGRDAQNEYLNSHRRTNQ